ncbi:MAG: hypothetical protein K6F25_05050 [Bacteroidales bacterium]|nr:hypothetical protein [Bacteroidales bacterium]
MNAIIKSGILFLLACLISCQRLEVVRSAQEEDPVSSQLQLRAVYEGGDESKVDMSDGGVSMHFSEGDVIGVTVAGSSGIVQDIPFTAHNTTLQGCDFLAPEGVAVNVGEGDVVYASYPFDGVVGGDPDLSIGDWAEDEPMTKSGGEWSSTKTVTVASQQVQPAPGDFSSLDDYILLSADPATVTDGSATLVFSPVTAQVNIQFRNDSGSALTVDKFVLSTDSDPDVALSGAFELDMTACPKLSETSFALSPVAGQVSNSVTLTFPSSSQLAAGATAELYFVVNAFTASSLTLTVHTSAGRHIIKKDFASDKRDFTRRVRRHIAFTATGDTFVAASAFNDPGVTPHVDGEPYDSYQGLVMAGYQGWQTCPGDGSLCNQRTGNDKWGHYVGTTVSPFRMEKGARGNAFNFWPDCSEYEKTYALPGFTYPDGSQAYVYSAYDEQTVMTHFRWMKEYGIDGAFAQRFMVYVNKGYADEHELHMVNLDHQMKASNVYGRAICVMYDLVGMGAEAHLTPEYLMQDLAELEAKYHFKDRSQGQKYYLYHNGKPLIALVSFAQADMPYDMTECRECVELLQAAGYSVMIGVPAYWRDGGMDSPYTTELLAMIDELHPDVLMPWSVGRYDHDGTTPVSYKSTSYLTSFDDFKSRIKDDADWCSAHGVDYAPNVWPGFDWSHQRPASVAYDRHGGDFFWKQAYYDIAVAGAKMIYIAMFDEIDEGTAIYKMLRKSEAPSNIPDTDFYLKYVNGEYTETGTTGPSALERIFTYNSASKWWELSSTVVPDFNGIEDEYQTDHYLWLTGRIRAMLRGEMPMTETKPTR